MSYGQQPQTGQYSGGYYPNYNQQQGMYPTPPGPFGHHPHAAYPYPPQGGYHPGISQQQGAGQQGYVPPPQFTGFFLDNYHGGDEAMDDDDDEQDEEEVVQVSEEVANMIVKRAAVQLLSSQGFKSAAKDTLNTLVHETVTYIESLYESARQYADLAGNSKPSAFDVLAALEDHGVTAGALSPKHPPGHNPLTLANGECIPRRRAKKRKQKVPGEPVVFDTGDISDPEPVFEADEIPYVPQTFRGPPFSHYLPPLPAKHTYLCSPPSPPQRSTLSLSVEKKLQNTAQVRNALKSLMDATDEPAEPMETSTAAAPLPVAVSASDDKDEPQEPESVAQTTTAPPTNAPVIPPRGYKLKQANIVNWQESFAMTRKRWKVTAH